jgi:hypothetical protein
MEATKNDHRLFTFFIFVLLLIRPIYISFEDLVKYGVIDLQSLFGLNVHRCTHRLRPRTPPPSPHSWAHIRGRYWSAKTDDISL